MAMKTDSILELEDRAQKLQALASLLKDPALDDVVSKRMEAQAKMIDAMGLNEETAQRFIQ